ncbi:hypothetical protein ACFQ6B_31445 [Streptomyces wedmorensis]|uniref:DUF4276 family protein n=1 Tax=Streptomyces wedmorensis TaxID=43759 RepID=A0ABW6J7S4_STRWE
MTVRVVYLCEGSSDEGIAFHIEQIAAECNVDIVLSIPDFRLLPGRVDRTVAGKLRAVQQLGGNYDLAIIHRDADRDGPDARRSEIADAVGEVCPEMGFVSLIPVTMTEAWLLLDENAIRQVAENPKGKMSLSLPKAAQVENIADPKERLKAVLALASDLSGRRLRDFQKRFSQNRRRLLEQLDCNGSITGVPSWRAFREELEEALMRFSN